MAHKVWLDVPPPSGQSGARHLFTVNDTPIGIGQSINNKKRSDVQLIQFFLKQFYDRHPEIFKKLPKVGIGATSLVIDGVCGDQTKSGIYRFQEYENKQGRPISMDSLVDVPKSLVASRSKTVYTILALNLWHLQHGLGDNHYTDLENHPDVVKFAPELQSELSA